MEVKKLTENTVLETEQNEAEMISAKQERKSVVVRCSKGFGAGSYKHEACGRLFAIWTIFDPVIGGHRKRPWQKKCSCGKITRINPEAGNILKVFLTRAEGEEYAEAYNVALTAREGARAALEDDAGLV